jgi:uncharacterized damage-inducible protein DinB
MTEPSLGSTPATAATLPGTPAETLFPDLEAELAATRRMLDRVPDGRDDWRPHEKSMTLGELATHVAELPGFAIAMLESDELDFEPPGPVPSKLTSNAERIAVFEERSNRLRTLIRELTWERAAGRWQMRIGGRTVVEGVRAELVRRMGLTHMAHHRAQLGVYLRLLGVPIPGTYGPSADEPPPRD